MMQHTKPILAALLALLLITPTIRAEEAPAIEPYEAWFVLKIGGQKAGYMHTTLKQDGDTLVNTSAMQVAIKRGQAEIQIQQSSRFVETLDHKPVLAESSMAFSTMATQQRLDFTTAPWTLTTTTAGQPSTTKIEPPKDAWLTPGALAKTLEAAIAEGKDEITVTTFDLSTGSKPIVVTMKKASDEDIEVFGKVVPATKWTTTMSAMPGMKIQQWTNAAGQPVRQQIPMLPGMDMEMLLADEQLAKAEFDAPEILAASLISPDKKIKNPRKLSHAVFELVGKDLKKNVGDTVPNTGVQSATWVDDNTLRIEIDLTGDVRLEPKMPGDEYLAATTMLNHKDDAIQDVREKLNHTIESDGGGLFYAQAMQEVVRNFIDEKDLSVGFASASEVARTGKGDCTEHACLLAAVLRAGKVPTRTVTGLVYADQFAGREGVFGFHMWTQAWVKPLGSEGYWLDLDAAAPGEINGFDATHIALSTSAMKDGESFNDMITMIPLMQGLEIKVVVTHWVD